MGPAFSLTGMGRSSDGDEPSLIGTSNGTPRAEGWTDSGISGSASALSVFTDEVVDIFSNFATLLGFPKSYGQIYGLLYGSVQPLSFSDIQNRLGLSKGSVSQGLRALKEFGAIIAASGDRSGGRADHYLPETEVRKLAGRYLRDKLGPQIKSGLDRLAVLENRLQTMPSSQDKTILVRRTSKLRKWQKKGIGALPVLVRLLTL